MKNEWNEIFPSLFPQAPKCADLMLRLEVSNEQNYRTEWAERHHHRRQWDLIYELTINYVYAFAASRTPNVRKRVCGKFVGMLVSVASGSSWPSSGKLDSRDSSRSTNGGSAHVTS